MDFKEKIINFLKEDIDSIKSLKVAAAGDETPLRVRDTPPEDIRTKSYFLENYVHQIVFKNIVQGQKRFYYTIYRKITKEEYDKLKKNYQVTYAIKPTDVEEHSEDVYYTPEKTYNKTAKFTTNEKTFTARNFLYLKKSEVDSYNSKLPSEYKLELVPIKDIYEKGIGARSITIKDYIEYVESQERKKSAPKKDKIFLRQNKEKVVDFFSNKDVKTLIKKIKASYKKRFSPDISKEDRITATEEYKEARKDLSDEIKDLVYSDPENKDKIEELIFDDLQEKFVSEKLFFYFKKYYEEGEADSAPEKPAEKPVDDKPSSKDKEKSTYKYTPKDDKKVDTSRTSIEPTGDFLSKGNNTSTLRTAIQLYSDFLYAKSKADKDSFSSKFYGKVIPLVSSVVNDTKDLKSSEKAMSEIEEYIKDFFKKQLIPEKPDLYNRIKIIYDKMKQDKSSQRITEAEERKDYVVATVVPDPDNPKLNAQPYKQYDANLNKRLTGVAGEFILKLDKKQAESIKRMSLDVNSDGVPKKGIISITSADEYKKGERTKKDDTVKKLKGYRSASGAKKVKFDNPDTYFNPKNPNDIAALRGKAKPGEKVYNVNFKIGSKSDDVSMTLSQIKKFVPDFEVVPDAKQQPVFDFEMEKPRTKSKDTGKIIYDKIKGSLKLNTARAVNEPPESPKSTLPVQYFVINRDSKTVVKGFATEKEADDFAKRMGSSQYISVNKLNLPKYGINLMSKNRPSESKIKEEFDEKDVKRQKVSFDVAGLNPKDPDEQTNIAGVVKRATFNKEKKELIIFLDDNSKAIFTGTGTGNVTGVYDPDPADNFGTPKKINDIKEPLISVLEKIFPRPSANTKLESYIRQRIRRALQEIELAQSIRVQGPAVKKKRLEEYMKRYEWGFQQTEDLYLRGVGSEKHAIVNKLVHELGDEGVAMFNSYAPKGYEIARPDDLNDMADTPLGSQLYQPYDPNSLTARGGRIAEEDDRKVISMAKPYIDAFNDKYGKEEQEDKYIENLAQGYVDKDSIIMDSETVRKYVEKSILEYIQKVSEKGTKKDIDPNSKILKALNLISNRKMTNYR